MQGTQMPSKLRIRQREEDYCRSCWCPESSVAIPRGHLTRHYDLHIILETGMKANYPRSDWDFYLDFSVSRTEAKIVLSRGSACFLLCFMPRQKFRQTVRYRYKYPMLARDDLVGVYIPTIFQTFSMVALYNSVSTFC